MKTAKANNFYIPIVDMKCHGGGRLAAKVQ
jgi:hypothetical protein